MACPYCPAAWSVRPCLLPDVGWRYGVPFNYVKRLTNYWRTGYDWRHWDPRDRRQLRLTPGVVLVGGRR